MINPNSYMHYSPLNSYYFMSSSSLNITLNFNSHVLGKSQNVLCIHLTSVFSLFYISNEWSNKHLITWFNLSSLKSGPNIKNQITCSNTVDEVISLTPNFFCIVFTLTFKSVIVLIIYFFFENVFLFNCFWFKYLRGYLIGLSFAHQLVEHTIIPIFKLYAFMKLLF